MERFARKRTPYKSSYSSDDLNKAFNAIKNNGMSVNRTIILYGIQRTTLMDKVHGRRPLQTTQGPKPVPSPEEEQPVKKLTADKIFFVG